MSLGLSEMILVNKTKVIRGTVWDGEMDKCKVIDPFSVL